MIRESIESWDEAADHWQGETSIKEVEMHVFDPSGAIRAYRKERDRKETYRVILFAMGTVGVLTLLVGLGLILSSMAGQ